MAHPGCSDFEYPLLMSHGWFTPKCPCDILQQQQTKHYKTTSTSTESSPSYRTSCANCDVPRRSTPPAYIGFYRNGSPVQGAVGGVGCSSPNRTTGSPRPGGSPRSCGHSPPSKAVSPLHSAAVTPGPSPPRSGTSSPRSGPSPPRFSPGSPQVAASSRSLVEGPVVSRLVASSGPGNGAVLHLTNMTTVVNMPRGSMPYNRQMVPSASADTITCRHHMAVNNEDPYVNLNPCYKSTTPTEEVLGPYPIMTQPMSMVEFAPASLPSLPEAAEKESAPPRSSTAPNVRGLDEELTESDLWQQRGLSPRASWSGPDTATEDPLAACMSTSASWHIYDEVYIPVRAKSPEVPERSSSLPQQPIYEPVLRKTTTRTSIPRFEMFNQRVPQRSMSQQAVYAGSPQSNYHHFRGSAPAIKTEDQVDGLMRNPSPVPDDHEYEVWTPGIGMPVSPPYAEVWIPQVPNKLSTSFTAQQQKRPTGQKRLSQSCEQLSSGVLSASTSPNSGTVPCCTVPRYQVPEMEPYELPQPTYALSNPPTNPSTNPPTNQPTNTLKSHAATNTATDEPEGACAALSEPPQLEEPKNGNGKKTSKQRCPTPPRVLSPSVDNYKYRDIADI